ncbi:enoyl-CoA hydratase/isomerase family protein [uncultured Corynebacterium sp.]|uniref:enoyl-CoA hydratase/isomerase family protein n=1 Tax=uncultured Corynebacterium sp. TaxID=159447 RepID=UPI0025D690EE|nr:enoyl-CoA hydratase/isomerase family protein [uncultured Corynebacterium sp.]
MTESGLTVAVLGTGAGTTGVITLDRPRALNALNLDMIRGIAAALDRFAADDGVRQVLIRSASPKAFCSGGDVRSVRETDMAGDRAAGDTFFLEEYDVNDMIATFPKPVIALIDGITMGGGMGVSMHASHRVITPKAWASMPEAAIGFVTDVGISHVLTHLPTQSGQGRPSLELGLWLAATAYRMTAGDLLWTGLATQLVTDADAFTDLLFAEGPDAALAATVPAREYPDSALAGMAGRIVELMAGARWPEIDARLRADGNSADPTAALTRDLLAPASPGSLEAMAALLEYSSTHTLREALDAEFALGRRARQLPDFAEGVRAVLVDKTKDAAFVPATLAEIGDGVRAEIRAVLADPLRR